MGDFLYFASDRSGGAGGFDLYRSRLIDGRFEPPERLDDSINTSSNELDPALSQGGFRYKHGDRPLEGYTILRGLGRGGFGEVYYAVSDGGREVALKSIQQNHDVELRGVRHCMNLKSPHLVCIFDLRHDADDMPYVVMEYVAGPSFREILRDAPEQDGLAPLKWHEMGSHAGRDHLAQCTATWRVQQASDSPQSYGQSLPRAR